METPPFIFDNPTDLAQLLERDDIWVGQSKRAVSQGFASSGFEGLDNTLAGGWPTGSLLEVCQQGSLSAEWLLFAGPLAHEHRPIFLLNPPMLPFCPALAEMGIDLNRLYIVRTLNKISFVNAFVELARSSQCGALLAWQPKESLTYTELRKCLLACSEGSGIYSLFRPSGAQKESSPANLRLAVSVQQHELKLSIFKQRGMLESHDTVIRVALRDALDGHLPLHRLNEIEIPGIAAAPRRKLATVIPLRRR